MTQLITKHIARINQIFLFSVSMVCAAQASAQSDSVALPEDVVAMVNGQPIPKAALNLVTQQMFESGEEANLGSILEELINLELLTQAAKEMKLEENPDIAATLRLQHTQTIANAYLAEKSAQMTFSDETLQAEYDIQIAESEEYELRASHILLETEEEAQAVIEELTDGKSFLEAASEHSIDPAGESGGDLGWFAGASMSEEFYAAAAQMEIGDISEEPVKTDFGYHIINVVDKRKAAPPAFDVVKSQLKNLAIRRALAEHVEELRAAAEIETE